jgi:hypothetical protein
MPRESGTKQERIPIQYFEGVNSTVQQVIARRTELSHMENARAPIIGVLEKREGQVTIGTDIGGGVFTALNNYGVIYFNDGGSLSKGLIRITSKNGVTSNIYYLNQSDEWVVINNDIAKNLSLAVCDSANVEGNLIIVNGTDSNKMIIGEIDATPSMVDSTVAGSLYNSPRANKVAFYKNRIYLADYYDASGNELKTTVLRSSYPMGIISLINGDVTAAVGGSWTIPVIDMKYFYTATGMNAYEIYRGNQKVATITINGLTETSIVAPSANVVFETGFSSFLSSDEIWINGTFSGEKQYRWVSNSSSTGRDVKQYDTFKIVGGDEDPITLFEPIGNILMMANKNTIMTWNDYTLENFDTGIGCCSKNGYVKLKGSLYFIHYSGIYSTSGSVPQLLSRKVERYIRGATKAGIESAASGFKGLSVFFTIGDVTLYKNDGSLWKILPQVCLEFNVADQNWYVHTNVTSTQFETYIQTNGSERLSMCSITLAKNEVLGSELITNGIFDGDADGWVTGNGWVYGSNKVTFTAP